MLRTLPKAFSRATISQVETSQVCSTNSDWPPIQSWLQWSAPYPTLSAALGPSVACSAYEGLTYILWKVVIWEIVNLVSCHLRNCHLGSRSWKNAFGKAPFTPLKLCLMKHNWDKNVFIFDNWVFSILVSLQKWLLHISICCRKTCRNYQK